MGNTVISGILFQPPSPPNPLDNLGPTENNNNGNSNSKPNTENGNSGVDNGSENKKQLAKRKRPQNLSINYLWLYSQNEYGEFALIPAIHITHTNPNDATESTPDHQQQQQQQHPHNQQHHQQPDASTSTSSRPGSHKYTLLYSHGNAEDLGLISSFIADLARLLQINVLCYDYSGYGMSVDEAHVFEFWKGYGREVEAWKIWRGALGKDDDGDGGDGGGGGGDGTKKVASVTAKNGNKCRFSKEVFVAPIIHPPPPLQSSPSSDNDDATNNVETNDCLDDDEDETGSVHEFITNACSPTALHGLGLANGTRFNTDGDDDHHHHHHDDDDDDDNGITDDNDHDDDRLRAQRGRKMRRRRFLARNAWTRPSPSESNCYANVRAAYGYLTGVEGVVPRHVILYGKSVGSGPTCWLAQRLCRDDGVGVGVGTEKGRLGTVREGVACDDVESREPTGAAGGERGGGGGAGRVAARGDAPGGVVLHSPFLSVIRVVLDVGFTTIGDLFPNFDRVGDFTCPVYIIHGSDDAIVPFYHGQTLFETLPDSSKTVPFWARGAGHNNIEMDMPTAYIKRLQQFVRQCDRLNYPNQSSAKRIQQQQKLKQQMLLQASLQASLRQSMNQQQQQQQIHHETPIPMIHRKPSKQRKKKGTLVMRSCHNHMQPPPLGPTPAHVPPTPLHPQQVKQQQQQQRVSASNQSNGSNMRSGGGGGGSSMSRNNWTSAAPSHHSLTVQQHQQQVQQQQQQQIQIQHTDRYAANNNHVRYHRPMDTNAVPQSAPRSVSPHHSSRHHEQSHQYSPQHQQFSQQQQQHLQYHPQRTAYTNSPHRGGGVAGWQ